MFKAFGLRPTSMTFLMLSVIQGTLALSTRPEKSTSRPFSSFSTSSRNSTHLHTKELFSETAWGALSMYYEPWAGWYTTLASWQARRYQPIAHAGRSF